MEPLDEVQFMLNFEVTQGSACMDHHSENYKVE